MKPLTDKMIAEALAFKKNKIWETLKPDNLLALIFADGTVGDINVFCPTGPGIPWIIGFALFRADELYSYHFMVHSPKGMDEVEARVQSCLMSCLWLNFASKDRIPEEFVDAIRQYRTKKGLHAYGKNAFFQILRYAPQLEPETLTDRSDRTHVEEALHFLNWLSRHGGGEGFPVSDGKIPCFKASGRTYDMTEIDQPPMKEYDFPKVPFPNEVLAHRLKKAGRRGILDCNLVTLPMAVAFEEDEHPYFPWVLLAYPEDEDYSIDSLIYKELNEKMVESLAEEFIKVKTVPREIHVINHRTQNLLADFCRKTDIRLVMGKGRNVIEDMSHQFYSYVLDGIPDDVLDQLDDGTEGADFQDVIDSLTTMSDDVLRHAPGSMRQAISEQADELPGKLRRRLSRLWGWKK